MMTDPLSWSPINLGRWAGTQVRIHFTLLFFAGWALLGAAIGEEHRFLQTVCWIALLFGALAVHEFGHAVAAWWLGCEPDDVRLWPLGNMVGPSPPARSADHFLVALAGPAANAAVVLVAAVALNVLGAYFVWSPFGNPDNPNDPGAPTLAALKRAAAASATQAAAQAPTPVLKPTSAPAPAGKPATPPPPTAAPFSAAWVVGWFCYLNWVILLANLLPALPFDCGRMFRAYLANTAVTPTKDGMIPPLFARSCALILVIVGLVRLLIAGRSDGLYLLSLALLIELMVRTEARMIEDGGFFDEGVFGYDFSEGYTSLEGSAAKVRPYRESAIKRWRRRRSDLRRQRRQSREAAEERRMDEILEKLHRAGRSALTDEEQRFLVRVSAKYRNKPRARD